MRKMGLKEIGRNSKFFDPVKSMKEVSNFGKKLNFS